MTKTFVAGHPGKAYSSRGSKRQSMCPRGTLEGLWNQEGSSTLECRPGMQW